ncbi:MAG: UDP-N-acetylmuramoyl-L-alanine--D-glutamate ligase [Bacteroidetes bacterium]|nr:UDP-N-acetylmuramoyl-L-alanine--D-glutamate ligase [Bacteroidota bacterium]
MSAGTATGKGLVVLGAQESGVGAALLARKLGIPVFVSDAGPIPKAFSDRLDEAGIAYEQGGHTVNRILQADEVVKSPGIPETASIVRALRAKGVPVIAEVEFAGRHVHVPIIGITGSNGKTTTTLLVHHILRKAGINAGLAGNVGTSFAGLVAREKHDVLVLELSSFQLDGTRTLKPHIAVITNITPDHLDRYEHRMENYVDSKFRITMNQGPGDHFIYCADDPQTREGLKRHDVKARRWPFSIRTTPEQGGFLQNDSIHIHINQTTFTMSILELALQGKHNVYNSLAAGIAARVMEVRNDVVRDALADFRNVEHRLERVGMVNGVEFINDSKATNVNSTWFALESMEKPVIWVMGGVDKGNDYNELRDLARRKVKAIICLGRDNTKIHQAFGDIVANITDADTADKAVNTGYEMSEPGDVVLLSPACASFDLFENYEDRGRKFKAAVRAL